MIEIEKIMEEMANAPKDELPYERKTGEIATYEKKFLSDIFKV